MAEHVAVVIIIDSSMELAMMFGTAAAYIQLLLARLNEQHKGPNTHLNVGLIAYGVASQRPSPIIARRYFNHPQTLLLDLKKDYRLFVGKSTSGGHNGLAALEGYAAAIELFDHFAKQITPHQENSEQSNKHPSPIFHIIHITCSMHDESVHPIWNVSSDLDELSWASLPEELNKRNIHLNIVLLKQLQQWQTFHHSVVPEPAKPFIQLRGDVTLLLAAQSAWTGAASKRPTDGQVPDSPDAKRQRTTSSAEPPSPSPTKRPEETRPKVEPKVETIPSAPPAVPSARAPADRLLMMQKALVGFQEKFKALQLELGRGAAEIQQLKSANRHEDAMKRNEEMRPKLQAHNQMKIMIEQLQKAIQQSISGTSLQKPQDSNNSGIAVPQEVQSVPGPSGSSLSQQIKPPPDRQTTAQLLQNRFSQPLPESKPPTVLPIAGRPPSGGIPPNYAAQMQKLMQQQQAARNAAFSTQQQKGEATRWIGTLAWTGYDHTLNTKVEVSAQVIVKCQTNADIRPDLWPPVLNLSPSQEQMVPIADLRIWIKKHEPRLCAISPNNDVPDAVINAQKFRSLHTLLEEKKVYAITRWVVPRTGTSMPTMVIFPGPTGQLAAAVFPETGVPELPQRSIPPPMPAGPSSISPTKPGFPSAFPNMPAGQQELARLAAIRQFQLSGGMGALSNNPAALGPNNMWPANPTNDAAQMGLGNMFGNAIPQQPQPQHQQLQQLQPQQLQQLGNFGMNMGGVNLSQGLPNVLGGINPANLNPAQFAALAAHRQATQGNLQGLHNQGMGNMPNLSYDMLQSFMQRNPGAMDSMK